jgi:peptide/nickel transport system permease protein
MGSSTRASVPSLDVTDDVGIPTQASVRPRRPSLYRRLKLNVPVVASFGLLALIVVLAVAAPLLTPYGPNDLSLRDRLTPPLTTDASGSFRLMGTDALGRDITTRVLHGARFSLLIGLASVALGGTIGLILGLLAGYVGGFWEDLIMRAADLQIALPNMVLYLAILAVLGGGVIQVILILGFTGWVAYARVARGQVLALKQQEFVLAAQSLGATARRIVLRHITPNIFAPVIVIGSFDVAKNIVVAAALSFIGVGIPPAVPTWGGMLSEARDVLRLAWWPATLPGVSLMLLVLTVNLIGDWLRDLIDPRLDA